MKKPIIVLLLVAFFSTDSHSQGCVMIRNISGFGQFNFLNNSFSGSDWQIDITSRYYKAYHTYWGKEDITPDEANQMVNHVYSFEVTATRFLKNGWSLDLNLPYTDGSRTSAAEHGGKNTQRYTTRASGLGDIRFTVHKWLFAPSATQKGNIMLGLGIKLPSGDYKYQDYFHKTDSTKVLSYVNPSIQLGDGGTGIITEVNAYYFLNKVRTLSAYGNFYYMLSPREQNGVLFTAGGPPPANPSPGTISYENSVPDLYTIRAGLNYDLKNWGFSLGMRDEGAPVYDLIGGSNGLRRPGNNVSVEPGIIYNWKKTSVYFYMPFFVSHEIKKSVPDKLNPNQALTAPGGSGDYLVFLGVQFRL